MSPTPNEKEGFSIRLTEIIEANITNKQFGVSELAREMGMSRSNLHRRVKSLAGTSISKFITRIRLERAVELLKESSSTISEIAFECGFQSVTYFSKCFRDHYGYPPGEERKHESGETGEKDHQDWEAKIGIGKKRIPILYLYSAIIILILVVVFIVVFKPFADKAESPDKSIAVLPFINDSPDEENTYFINGIMESILNNLGKIKDLRVVSRNSVEQYRNNPKPTKVIADEMNVSYVIEGSGQLEGDRIRLSIQLIDAVRDQHVWSETYNRPVDEIFELQSEIAQLVAGEIKAIITPAEKGLIEIIPTESRTAYDLLLKANQEINNSTERASCERAIDFSHHALEFDSSFASPYITIARAYLLLNWRNPLENAAYLDSVIYYVNLALSLNPQLEHGYQVRGGYYYRLWQLDRAIADFDRATEINPNLMWAYQEKGWVHYWNGDFVNSFKNFTKCLQLAQGPELPNILHSLGVIYNQAGFHKKYKELLIEKIALDRDTMDFYILYAYADLSAGNYREAIGTAMKGYAMDSTETEFLNHLGKIYYNLRLFDSARFYFDRYIKLMEAEERFVPYDMYAVPYIYQKTGEQEKAQFYTMKLYEYYKNKYYMNTEDNYFFAFCYMLMGEIDKVYDQLSEIAKSKKYGIWNREVRNAPIFDEISSEPEFLSTVDQIEARYQEGHERIRQWLEENEML